MYIYIHDADTFWVSAFLCVRVYVQQSGISNDQSASLLCNACYPPIHKNGGINYVFIEK